MQFSDIAYRLRRRRHMFLAVFALLGLTLFVVFGGSSADAGSRVVTVSADGFQRTIQTRVGTVAEALERADVVLGDHDLVEPTIDTEILEPIFSINVYRARPVTVVDGEITRQIMSPYRSERLIAADAGIVVYPEDKFTMEQVSDIVETGFLGQRLTVIRATPVTIELYGNTLTHRTHAGTVGEVLAERGIELKNNDKLLPSIDETVRKGMTISLVHTGSRTVTEEVPLEYSTDVIYDNNRLMGEREVVEPGQDGVRLVTYEIYEENGREVSRNELQSVVKTEAATELVIVGTLAPNPDSNIAIGQSLSAARGWTGGEWQCLYDLWMRESRWNHLAENPYSGAYGIPQALPGTKMSSHGSDWLTNPATQIAWGLDYIAARYGTPCGAWRHSEVHNWY